MFDLIPFNNKRRNMIQQMLEDFEKSFEKSFMEGFTSMRMPNIFSDRFYVSNIREFPDRYVLEIDLPGFKKDEIKIEVKDGRMCIDAETTTVKQEEKENSSSYERSARSYHESFGLGDDVDENRITAEYKDGVLKIDVMKTEVKPEDKPKRIDIK